MLFSPHVGRAEPELLYRPPAEHNKIVDTVIPVGVAALALVAALVPIRLIRRNWRKLAVPFGTSETPKGRVLRWQSMTMGSVFYRSVVTVGMAAEGLYLGVPFFSLGQPNVLVPWDSISAETEPKGFSRPARFQLWYSSVPRTKLEIVTPVRATLYLSQDLLGEIQKFKGGKGPGAAGASFGWGTS